MTSITWGNQGTVSQSLKIQLENLTRYTADYINSYLARPINFDISLTIDNSKPRFAGNGDVVRAGDPARADLWEGVGSHQARMGVEVSGYDTKMFINQAYLEALFLDPTPQTANDLPAGRVDAFSVLLHETLHSLGFVGWTDWATYANTAGAASPFDDHIVVSNGRPYFDGENAVAAYGGLVPLTAGNVFHLGNATGNGTDLVPDLMNGVVFNYATRYQISNLDLAILADFGIGTVHSDILRATAGVESLSAGAGNDVIYAAAGPADRINGGSGSDMVVYSGNHGSYGRALQADGSIRVTKAGNATDVLDVVERVRFDDGDLIFDLSSGQAAAAYRLYGGAFDRTPDEGGLRFWSNDWLDAGQSLHDAAAQFVASQEFVKLYGASMSDAQFVGRLYQNVLHRAGEAGGQKYWQDYLTNRSGDRADVLVQFTQLPEYVGNSATNIDNGYWVIKPQDFTGLV